MKYVLGLAAVILVGSLFSQAFAAAEPEPWHSYYEQPATITSKHFTTTYGNNYELIHIKGCEAKLWEEHPDKQAYVQCDGGFKFVSYQISRDLPVNKVVATYGRPHRVEYSPQEKICSVQYYRNGAAISFDFDDEQMSGEECENLMNPVMSHNISRVNVIPVAPAPH